MLEASVESVVDGERKLTYAVLENIKPEWTLESMVQL